jgi:signal transduction histidine kinase
VPAADHPQIIRRSSADHPRGRSTIVLTSDGRIRGHDYRGNGMRWAARLYRWLGRTTSEHPFATDVVFAAVVGALTVAGVLSAEPAGSQRDADALAVVLVVAQAAALVFRRRAPFASLVGVMLPVTVFWVLDYATNFDAMSLISVYSATAHSQRSRRVVWRVVGSIIAVLTAVGLAGVLSPEEDLPPIAVLGIAAIHVSGAAVGEVVHERRRRLAELEERAVRAEAERELLARQAVLRERTSIARDLHDVVAHGMSVMVVQAGAAQRLVRTQPERAEAALEQIQRTGREALTEMRRMLGVLRNEHDAAELDPQPTLDDLGAMVQRCIDAGIPTELTVVGEPPARSAAAELTAYRIVQEALTNVIKHAGRPVRAAVRLTYTDDQVRLEILDDGIGATDGALAATTGHGLVGMRERVELYHGTLRAGARPGGGFRVSAVIPLDPAPSAAPTTRVAS